MTHDDKVELLVSEFWSVVYEASWEWAANPGSIDVPLLKQKMRQRAESLLSKISSPTDAPKSGLDLALKHALLNSQ